MTTQELRATIGRQLKEVTGLNWIDWYPVMGTAGIVVDAVPADDPDAGAASGYTYDAAAEMYLAPHNTPDPVVLNRFQDAEPDGGDEINPMSALDRIAAAHLVLCRSDMGDGGWSLHPAGSSDEDIAEGIAPVLADGTATMVDDEWDAPTEADYAAALAAARRMEARG